MKQLPRMIRIRQRFDSTCIEDPRGVARQAAGELLVGAPVAPGQTVAVTGSSRGIAHIADILAGAVEALRKVGLEPFIVPAMGSHGGGSADGQRRIVESYGMTEEFLGCPIRSSMETVVIGHASKGFPIHFDRLAFEADHVVVCNRVKPHTGFAGTIESGLMKMLLIGLGNCEGAKVYHRAIQDFSFDQIIRDTVGEVLARCPILAGLGVVENAYEEMARIEAIFPQAFEIREKELLVLAKRLLPQLPFQHVDVLVVDRIGKDISGTGLDPNVVGRKFNDHKAMVNEFPKVRRIAVRGLTPRSRGNAIGLGIAEFCRSPLLRETDFAVTRLNGLISGHVSAVMTPLDYETDREMLAAALGTIGLTEPSEAKLLWIADTLRLGEVECSETYLNEAQHRADLEILGEPRDLPFDIEGNLPTGGLDP